MHGNGWSQLQAGVHIRALLAAGKAQAALVPPRRYCTRSLACAHPCWPPPVQLQRSVHLKDILICSSVLLQSHGKPRQSFCELRRSLNAALVQLLASTLSQFPPETSTAAIWLTIH